MTIDNFFQTNEHNFSSKSLYVNGLKRQSSQPARRHLLRSVWRHSALSARMGISIESERPRTIKPLRIDKGRILSFEGETF